MTQSQFGARELFRYTRVRPLQVIDLRFRAARDEELRRVLAGTRPERQAWASSFLESGRALQSISQLRTTPLAALDESVLDGDTMPPIGLDGEPPALAEKAAHAEECRNALCTVLALKILGASSDADRAARILQLLEAVSSPRSTWERTSFAPAILRDPVETPSMGRTEEATSSNGGAGAALREFDDLADAVGTLWQAQTRAIKRARRELEERHRDERLSRRARTPRAERTREEAIEEARAYFGELAERRRRMTEERRQFREQERSFSLGGALAASADSLASGIEQERIKAAQAMVSAAASKYGLDRSRFCQAIERAGRLRDESARSKDPLDELGAECFGESPSIKADTSIRVLGSADLIRVEERFIRYSEGEISSVENILAGEVRRREVKNTKYFEQTRETTTEETTDAETESSSTVSQDLSSQVQSEINTRMQSDVNASAEATGGGSIGVVDFDGSGSMSAGLGVGVDTSFSTATRSEFSQEIVNRSIERTRNSTLSRRLDRTYSLFETTNLHKIDNTKGDPEHRRGVYVFLDKHICITETTYGRRLFLQANVMLPGKNFVCEQRARRAHRLRDVGQRPTFDITPDDVQPGSYKELVGRFHATNVSPPPDPVIRLARTYKTDQTNLTADTDSGFKMKKVADVLVPFFERFQRFAVHETVKLPDGYEVQGVQVTVNHGCNGVSIPMHLPISLAGAGIYLGPTLMYSMLLPWVYMPFAIWQLAYMASPLLHYNTDSSNVTVCIGNEAEDSRYYFLSPDELMVELSEFLTNFLSLSPGLMQGVQDRVHTLLDDLAANGGAVPAQVISDVQSAINDLVGKLGNVFAKVSAALNPLDSQPFPGANPPDGELYQLGVAIGELTQGVTVTLSDLSVTLDASIVQPLRAFVDDVFSLVGEGIQNSLSDMLAMFLDETSNSQTLQFAESFGARRELPVSLNMVAIHPAITVNLVACLKRTNEALDKWRLETFGNLYHAYMQQVADYESRMYSRSESERRESPGSMRAAERRVMKELVLHALNNLHGSPGNVYSLERLNLFEHAIDWENMSYRLYNYGPSLVETEYESMGFFHAADARRRAFLTAPWAQVLLPLQPREAMESAILRYFDGEQEIGFEQDFTDDELAALYQDLILGRKLAEESPEVVSRSEIVPTDLIVLMPDERLPENAQTDCADHAAPVDA